VYIEQKPIEDLCEIILKLLKKHIPKEVKRKTNEIYQEENNTSEESSTYFKNIRLTKDFPINKEKGFYMYKMENLIIISESKAICNEVLMNSNNTTSTQDTLNFYLNELPRKVSERSISTKSKYTKSIYKNKIIETFLK
jgi:hypothetical protein